MLAYAPRSFVKARPTELFQLAGRWDGTMPEGGAIVERKWDGYRCGYFPGIDRKPGLWTRNGMPMPGAGHILSRLIEIEAAMGGRWMIDGELVVDGTLAATKAHYDRGWRLGNAGVFHAFDAVPLADWQHGQCDMPLFECKTALAGAIEATAPDASAWEWREGSRGVGHGVDAVELGADAWASTVFDVEGEARRVWTQGHEGLMVKRADARYIRARADAWLKVKHPGVN